MMLRFVEGVVKFIAPGAALHYTLKWTDTQIPAFLGFVLLCVLLWTAPALAANFVVIVGIVGVIALCWTFWEFVVSILLGAFLFVFFVGGLIHAILAIPSPYVAP